MMLSLPSRLAYPRLVDSDDPVVIVGMHRSGTSLLAKLLEDCGVHMGVRQSRSKTESLLFRDINTLVLELTGQSWRCIQGLPDVDELIDGYDWIEAKMRKELQARLVPDYLGASALIRIMLGPLHWGWKDPRTSLVLPLWSRIFPNARVIHICRDGRDAALSLLARDAKTADASGEGPTERQVERFIADFRLWELYLQRIQQASRLFSAFYSIRYEDLLDRPGPVLADILGWLGLDPRPAEQAARIVDPTRANRAKRNDPDWLRRLDLSSPRLIEHRYE